jgi:hypothetical protein
MNFKDLAEICKYPELSPETVPSAEIKRSPPVYIYVSPYSFVILSVF